MTGSLVDHCIGWQKVVGFPTRSGYTILRAKGRLGNVAPLLCISDTALHLVGKKRSVHFHVCIYPLNVWHLGIVHLTLCTDKSWFHLSGCLKLRNMRLWPEENPHTQSMRNCYSLKMFLWSGAFQTHIILPVFFKHTVNAGLRHKLSPPSNTSWLMRMLLLAFSKMGQDVTCLIQV